MADERDPKVSQRYRELGSEEPPPALDQSILAASRRATDKPHAPLVTPAGRHRWYFGVGAAAILVLAVAVTLHVERDRPDPESVVTARAPEAQKVEPAARADAAQQAPAPVEQAKPAPKPQAAPRKPTPPVFAPDPPTGGVRGLQVPDDVARAEPAPATPPKSEPLREAVPQAAPAPPPASPPAGVTADSAPKPMADGRVRSRVGEQAAMVESPAGWLEQIIQLRKEGKHDEADKALAEFRKRYPDYRISESTLEKVEKR